MEGIDRIAQSALLARFLEQPGRHAAADHVREHLQAVERRVSLRDAGQRQRDVHLFELALLDMRAAAEARRLARLAVDRRKQ